MISDPFSIHCLLNPEIRGNKKYDVVFTSFLLHCLPGPPERRAKALAELSHLIEPASGVLCGATTIGKRFQRSMPFHGWPVYSFLAQNAGMV